MEQLNIRENDLTQEDMSIIRQYKFIGIDTETTGLNPLEDNLCTIQISAGQYNYLIHFSKMINYTNIKKILSDESILKVFHHANFDIRFLMVHLKIKDINAVICTKVAIKLLCGGQCDSSLQYNLQKYLGINISKGERLSDWSVKELSEEQINYAMNDSKYLVRLWNILEIELEKQDLLQLASKCYEFLPTNAYLNNNGIQNIFIY